MKLSRRTILALAGAGSVLAQTPAQPPPPAAAPDRVAAAREDNRRNAEKLATFEIPMSTEPAFTFRA